MSRRVQISGRAVESGRPRALRSLRAAIDSQLREMRGMQEAGKASGEIFEDTFESMDELIAINDLGLLTTDSQQGGLLEAKIPVDRDFYNEIHTAAWRDFQERMDADDSFSLDTWNAEYQPTIDQIYNEHGGTWEDGVTMKQRAYLRGFLDLERARALVHILNQQIVVAWVIPNDHPGDPAFNPGRGLVSIPVTCDLTDMTGQDEFSPYDSAPMVCSTMLGNWGDRASHYYPEISFADDKYLGHVQIFDPRWDHTVTQPDGLFKRVIAALEEVNRVHA